MKNNLSSLLVSALLAGSLFSATGCPKQPIVATPALATNTPRESLQPLAADASRVSPASASVSPDPFKEMLAALEVATASQHEGLSAVQTRMDREIDAQVSARKAGGYDVSLAADEKLDSATEDFAEKVRMLSLSSTEVWASAKHDTELSLQNVRSAYAGIMNSPLRN